MKKKLELDCVREISGADVFGGEMINPIVVGLVLAGVGYVVEKWPEIKQGFLDGYRNQ